MHTGKIATATDPVSAIEATTRVIIDGKEFHTAGFGNGPVNALDVALRKALEPVYPWLADVELVDFKVRIVDMCLGTSAKTRVQVETKGKMEKFGERLDVRKISSPQVCRRWKMRFFSLFGTENQEDDIGAFF